MKSPRWRRHISWLWLSILCFALLFAVLSYEAGWGQPQVSRYFNNTGKLTDKQLATRARERLQNSLETLLTENPQHPHYPAISQQLNIVYGLLNVPLYLDEYPCAQGTLDRLDRLDRTLATGAPVSHELAASLLLPVIQCVSDIEAGQEAKRTRVALMLLEEIENNRRMLLWWALAGCLAGFGFWALHESQRRAYTRDLHDKLEWMHRASHDPLTGILNRRALDQDLRAAIAEYRAHGQLFSLVLCDIDYFKQYNDALGHPQGDRALKDVVNAIAGALRPGDTLYRYGGEEIAILLAGADREQGQRIAERVLERVRALGIAHPEGIGGILTASAGIALVSDSGPDAEAIIAMADRQLYQAKQSGRDQLF
ncbi:diguanylate cyclase domain-containing protein [Marinobacter oulmenensis]|uniref:diguanylate cyclase n=1 Tax=Marinobacter oulmenensis TaxID=643747 RepID=A0A840UGW1_9GAMM|nr:diguanylate cyclase (GGDEF)-like protein [Marinobacter oulmenensis]